MLAGQRRLDGTSDVASEVGSEAFSGRQQERAGRHRAGAVLLGGSVGAGAADGGGVALDPVADAGLQGASLAPRLVVRAAGPGGKVLAHLGGQAGGGGVEGCAGSGSHVGVEVRARDAKLEQGRPVVESWAGRPLP